MEKVKNVFRKIVVGIFACGIPMLLVGKLNGFFCLLLWVITMFIVVKTPYVFSGTLVIIGYIIWLFTEIGWNESFIAMLGVIVAFYFGWRYIIKREKVDKVIKEKRKAGKAACPYCGSSRIHYIQGYANTHTDKEEYYDYYKGWRYKDVIKTDYVDGYWKCLSCKRKIKDLQ